jgi:hypothetical protein
MAASTRDVPALSLAVTLNATMPDTRFGVLPM